uniref:Nucleoid-associated protein n=1 Tax=Siphoviridae sp. ctAkS7 TaxID=2827798 RepID=A0A8S5SXU0_9CAUD|nr:MAG TPA: nucleoid-associated protein [Siphoviridae sp. ctAkS7]
MSDSIEFNVSLNEPVNFNLEVGDQGPKGDKGDTGSKGETGDRGEKGDPGTTDYNQLQNKPQLDIYLKKSEANTTTADLLNKISQNTDNITDTKNSLRNYALASDVDGRISETKTELNEKISQAETRTNNTIGQAKTELNGKITEANNKTSSLDTKFTKLTSDNKAEATQIKANLATTNSVLSTHKELVDKKFTDVNTEQTSQNSLISDILNAFSKESEKGTNLKLNSSATKVLGMTIYGNLEQKKYTGKNITRPLYFSDLFVARTNTETGFIVKRGNSDKPSIGAYSIGHRADRKMWNNIVSQTDLVLSFSVRSLTNQKLNFNYRLEPLPYNNLQLTTSWQKVVYKVPKSNANNFAAFIFYASNLDMTDPNCGFEIKDVQIEAGTEATDYEPYVGSVLPNGFANLFDEFSNLPLSRDGVNLSDQNGVLKLTGQPTADWIPLTSRNITSFLQDKQTYTVFQPNIYGVKLYPEVIAQRKDGGPSKSWNGQNAKTFTFTVDFDTYSSYSMKLQMGPKTSYPEPITFYNNYALFVGNYTADNLPEYSPYNTGLSSPRLQYPQTVKELSGGNIKVVSKNFAVLDNKPYTNTDLAVQVNADGSITAQGENKNFWGMNIATNKFVGIPLKKGDVVTLSIDKPLPYTIKWYAMRDDNTAIDNFCNIQAGETSKTATIPANLLYGRLFFNIQQVGLQVPPTTFKIQLEYSDTATKFVPHESAQFTLPSGLNIYKLTDNIYDEIRLDNSTAKMIKRVGKLELSGDEEEKIAYYYTSKAGTIGFKYKNPSGEMIFTQQNSTANIICSHFNAINEDAVYTTRENKTGVSIYGGYNNFPRYSSTIGFWFTVPDQLNLGITDVTSFRNWLKSEKTKGTPVTVYYEMRSSTEEEITDPTLLAQFKKLMEMRTYDGTTNISITGTDLTPDIKVKYMKKIVE